MVFKDKYEPITVKIENIKGESFDLKSNHISMDVYDEIMKIASSMEKKENTDKITSNIYEMLILMFGKTNEFWSQFGMTVLTSLNEFASENILSPKKKEIIDG